MNFYIDLKFLSIHIQKVYHYLNELSLNLTSPFKHSYHIKECLIYIIHRNGLRITIENPSSTLSPKGKYVDIGDPNVQIILEREAKYLRDEVFSYLDKKLNIKTN